MKIKEFRGRQVSASLVFERAQESTSSNSSDSEAKWRGTQRRDRSGG